MSGQFARLQQSLHRAQPKQEPVAWQGVYDPTDLYWRKPPQTDVRPLYTAPQPQPDDTALLRQALEALDGHSVYKVEDAITKLTERLK